MVRPNVWLVLASGVLSILSTLMSQGARAEPFQFSYGGRLIDAAGRPVSGPVTLDVSFYRDAEGGSSILSGPIVLTDVTLTQGTFQISIELSSAEIRAVFPDTETPAYIQVTDTTHGRSYPRQRFSAVPLALKVPVDDSTITFDDSGRLTASMPKADADTPGLIKATGAFLVVDAEGDITAIKQAEAFTGALAGDVTGPQGATVVGSIRGKAVTGALDSTTDGHVLEWDNDTNSFVLGIDDSGAGAITGATIQDDTVESADLKDGTVASIDLASGLDATKIGGGDVTSAEFDHLANVTSDIQTQINAKVTSVGLTAPAAGITVTGSPVTSSGSITLGLADDLAAIEALTTTGTIERTGTDTWSTYTVTAAGKALLDDANAATQRTTLGLGRAILGPGSSTDNGIVRFDGSTGTLVQDSSNVVITDSGDFGIGTTTPDGLLDVGGRLKVKSFGRLLLELDTSAADIDLAGARTAFRLMADGADRFSVFGSGVVYVYNNIGMQAVHTGIGYGSHVLKWDGVYHNFEQVDLNVKSGGIRNTTGALTLTPAAGSNLNLALAGTGDFAVNADQLYVDTSASQVGIGTASPGQTLAVAGTVGIREQGATPAYYTIFQGADQGSDITYTLPAAAPGSDGQVLTSTTGGVLSWTSLGGSGLSSIGVTAPAAGITTSGSPLTSNGNITLGLANDLAAVEGLSATGIAKRTGADTWTTISDNSTNWDTAYADRLKWDGSAVGLDAAAGRTSLGLVIGTNVQAYDAQLTDMAALSPTNNHVIIGDGTSFVTESGATARASLGAAAAGVNSDITSLAGLTTALSIGQGGTGATTRPAALDALLPAQSSQGGKVLTTDGTTASWESPPISEDADAPVQTLSEGVTYQNTTGRKLLVNCWKNATAASCKISCYTGASSASNEVAAETGTDRGSLSCVVRRSYYYSVITVGSCTVNDCQAWEM